MYHITEMTKTVHWHDNGSFVEYHPLFGFHGKEQYLEQTAGWKAEYKELSKRIRQYKLWRKLRHRPSDITGYQVYNTLETMQQQARMMCQIRVAAKQESYRQMMAERKAA